MPANPAFYRLFPTGFKKETESVEPYARAVVLHTPKAIEAEALARDGGALERGRGN